MFPRYEEVMKCYEWIKFEIIDSTDTEKEPNFSSDKYCHKKIEKLRKKLYLAILSHVRECAEYFTISANREKQ